MLGCKWSVPSCDWLKWVFGRDIFGFMKAWTEPRLHSARWSWLQAERKLQQELKRIDVLVTPPSWYAAQRVIPLPWIHSRCLYWLIPFLCAMFQSNRVWFQKTWRWKCISRARLTGTPLRSKAMEKANPCTSKWKLLQLSGSIFS